MSVATPANADGLPNVLNTGKLPLRLLLLNLCPDTLTTHAIVAAIIMLSLFDQPAPSLLPYAKPSRGLSTR